MHVFEKMIFRLVLTVMNNIKDVVQLIYNVVVVGVVWKQWVYQERG